jgi:hypothetical protein
LENAGDAERDRAQRGALDDKHSEGNADENRDDHRDDNEREVIERGAEDFVAMFGEERPRGHLRAHTEAPGSTLRDEVKARTSGWSS